MRSSENLEIVHSRRIGQLVWVLAAVILGGFLLHGLAVAKAVGQTTDETFYNGIGYPIVRYNDYRMLGEHPPLVIALGALPLLASSVKFPDYPIYHPGSDILNMSGTGAKFLYEMGNNPYQILFWERVPIILLACLLGGVLFVWARELYGGAGALVALLLYSFCPNVLAHGTLYTTDMGATAFFFLAAYRLRKICLSPSLRNVLLAGVCCGLALLSKISTLLLIPLSALLFWGGRGASKPDVIFETNARSERWLVWIALLLFALGSTEKLVMASLGPICLIAAGAGGRGMIRSLSQRLRTAVNLIYVAGWVACVVSASLLFKKHPALAVMALVWASLALMILLSFWQGRGEAAFKGWIKTFSLLWMIAAITVMLGYTDFYLLLLHGRPFKHYLHNFLWSFSHSQTYHNSCVPGSFVTCDWKYFLGTMAVKTPSVTLFLFSCGLFTLLSLKKATWEKHFLLLPPVLFLGVASIFNRIHIGLRHILPVYPFLFLIAACCVPAVLQAKRPPLKILFLITLTVGLSWNIYTSGRIFPHYLAYFNEWVGGVERGADLVGDSNLNWGQDNRRLAVYCRQQNLQPLWIASSASSPGEYNYHQLRWGFFEDQDSLNPRRGFYALDVAMYRAEQQKERSWFKNRSPDSKIGKTFYLFEVK